MQLIEDSRCFKDKEVDGIFQSEEEMKRSLSRLCYGDLYLIGKIWVEALQAVLVGGKFRFIQTVDADMGWLGKEPETPKRPPPMKFKDLPIYEAPHYEYKDYVVDKEKCPEYKKKIIHSALLPHVSEYREKFGEKMEEMCCSIRENGKSVKSSIKATKCNIKTYMRHPDNLAVRQGVLATGTLLGYLLGGGGGIPRRFFFTSLGALSAGALCFPKETDERFREACYHSSKALLTIYNATCRKQAALRERIPCNDELPEEPKAKQTVVSTEVHGK